MPYTEKRFVAGSALGTGYTTLYTVTAPATSAVVKEVIVCNTSNTSATFTLNVVPNGGSAVAANTEFASVTLQPYETKIFGRFSAMAQGSTIQAKAGTDAVVSIAVSGLEYTP